MTTRTIPKLAQTEYAVLGLLAYTGRPISGYDLVKFAGESVGYIWSPSRSRTYEVLERLTAQRLATRRDVAQDSRPDKSQYRITALGRRTVEAWLAEEELEPDADRNPFLLKLFFGEFGDRDAIVRQLENYRAWTAERLRAWEAIERHIREHDDLDGHFPYYTLRFGIVRARATLRWADETLKELRR